MVYVIGTMTHHRCLYSMVLDCKSNTTEARNPTLLTLLTELKSGTTEGRFSCFRTPFSAHRDCHFSEMRQYCAENTPVLSPKYSSIVPKILEYCTNNTQQRMKTAPAMCPK